MDPRTRREGPSGTSTRSRRSVRRRARPAKQGIRAFGLAPNVWSREGGSSDPEDREPGTSTKSSSWVTTGTPSDMAVAAIQESLTGIRFCASRSKTRRRAQASAAGWSTGNGSRASASTNVASRRSRVSTSTADSTPARSSPTVITEMASSSGRSVWVRRRPDSLAINRLVSAMPRVNPGRRSCPGPARGGPRPERGRLGGLRNGLRTHHAISTWPGSRSVAALQPVARRQ